jgi:hypothetical protein
MGLLLLASCEKLVEVNSPDNQLGTAQVFEDVNIADAALGGLYYELGNSSVIQGGSYYGANCLLGSYADDLENYHYDMNGTVDIYQNQVLPTNTIIKSIWRSAYTQIYSANSIIQGAENSKTLSDTDKSRIKGEALFIRSLIYYYLQQIFGDIPYTTSLDYEYNRTIGKTDAAEVMEHLEADVAEAVALLGDDYRDAERIYVNRKTAQLLLANIYLFRSEWTLAEQTADAVLQSPLYQFQTDINEVFHNSGSHILWQLSPEYSGDATSEAMLFITTVMPYSYALSDDLMNTFDAGDLRRQVWISEVTNSGETWYIPYKYKNRSDNFNEYSIIFRLEEAYFIKAEALARQNRFDDALPWLNATRVRAGLTAFTSLSGDSFYNELLAEKRREFFAESGLRFIDLKRFGRLDDLSAVKPNWENYMQVLPLPESEMLLNPNLKPQNTGY